MQVSKIQRNHITHGGTRPGHLAFAATLAVALWPVGAQSIDVGVSVGGISVGVSVGGDNIAGVEGDIGSNTSISAEFGGSDSVAEVDANVGGAEASASVLPSGNAAPGTPDAPSTGPVSGGTPVGAIPGQPFLDVNTIAVTQRRRPASRCSGTGNYDVLNGIPVLDANSTFLGVVVGAYVTGTDLTRVRVSVDPSAASGGGCVEYTTAGGRATSQGIVINTTQASLQSALAR